MKGFIFTLDAIIAFGIVITIISGLIIFRTEIVSPFLSAQKLHLVSEDILGILYGSKLKEVVNSSLLQQYINDGTLDQSDLDKKTMDVLGALWSANKKGQAANITKSIFENFIPINIGYQIMINNEDFYNSSDTERPAYDNASIRITSSRIISGYEKYKPVSGYVARAWATKITKTVTKMIPINLAWGSFSAYSIYTYNGWAPTGVRNNWSIVIKNFTIPDDANISYAYLQMAFDTNYGNLTVNGNRFWNGSSLNDGVIREFDITPYVARGLNTIEIDLRRNTDQNLGHFHPGCYIKINYNTSVMESGSNMTVFNADWVRGAPSADETIPFFVNAPIRNVTAYVDVRDINAFLLLTLNYKYNASNPWQNVLLYREYPQPVDCAPLSQAQCQANPQCSWNTGPVNYTIFDDGFETDITTNWSATSRWARINEYPHTGSQTAKIAGSSTPRAGNLTTKRLMNTTGVNSIYVDSWFRDDDCDATDIWVQYNDSSGNWDNIRDIASDANYPAEDTWIEWTQNVTDSQYFHPGFAVRIQAQNIGSGENFWVDDFKIIKNVNGKCENAGGEDVKNRTYELFFNNTGTLINEYNDAGSLLNTWFNTNVTINNIFNDKTNIFGIYADIRKPENLTVAPLGEEDRFDWQRLGMFAHNNTNIAISKGDYYCYITEKTNVTVYHDIERYGLEYGKIDITAIENFTDDIKMCDMENCKDANLNLTFAFSTSILEATVLGTQNWGGNDNGYNFIWMWVNDTEPEEAHLVMSTDTPPGTFTHVPVRFLQTNKMNIIRVGDKSWRSRELNTDVSNLMHQKRSIVEYSFLIPSQVGYGDVFNMSDEATTDAENRLNQILGSFASATIISRESFRVGGVPYMYGPYRFSVNAWV